MNRHDAIAEPPRQEAGQEQQPLGFYDHGRHPYASRMANGRGLFSIGDYNADGSLAGGGEFKVALVDLGSPGRPALHPHLEAFGDGCGSLMRAIRAGLFSVMESVETAEQFALRLRRLGIVDRSQPGADRPPYAARAS